MKTCLGMLAVVFLTAPLTGCSGMQIRSDHDSSFDFSSLRTYAWVPDARPNTGDPRVDEQFLDEHVRRSVDRVLASTGFSRIEANRADFLVNYHAGVEVKLDESMSSEAHGYTEGWWGPGHDVGLTPSDAGVDYALEFDEGTLVLGVLDPATKQTLWRGSAQTEVFIYSSADARAAQIEKAVEKILARFPPR